MIKCFPALLLLLFFECKAQTPAVETSLFSNSHQLVLVLSPSEKSTTATLWRFDKKGKKWRQKGDEHPVNLGWTGLAWGRGLHDAQSGYQKHEGDGKAPAGIFRFGTAFGYASASEVSFKIDYLQVDTSQICVDDTASRYYNQIVDESTVTKDWKSKEYMQREDWLYKWGIYVEHNVPAEVGGGSCIFFHLWRKEGSATAGCTAMTEENLLELMHWLDPAKKPLLVQLVESEYEAFQRKYGLPEL